MSVAAMAKGVFNSSKVFTWVNRVKYFSMRRLVARPSQEGVQRPKSAKLVALAMRCMSSSGTPAQYQAPISAPTLVPETQSIGIPALVRPRRAPMCAMPRANPPASARPTRGRSDGLRSSPVARERNLSLALRSQSMAFDTLSSSILLYLNARGRVAAPGLTLECWFCNLSSPEKDNDETPD